MRSLKELVYRARFLVARALEAQGFVDDAIIELETMLSPRVGTVMQIKVGIALSRCYRESGDFSKAVEVGEMILEQLADTPLDSSDEAVQMAVTLAAAYFERGDTGQAVRVCRKAVTKAEKLESPKARASAYWNASIMEARPRCRQQRDPARRARPGSCWPKGRTLATSAVCAPSSAHAAADGPAADRRGAGAPDAGGRGIAVVQRKPASTSAATSWLRLDALYLAGDVETAQVISARVHDAVLAHSPADRGGREGRSKVRYSRLEERSRRRLVPTAKLFSCSRSVGRDRGAAQLWFELAGLLEEVGDLDACARRIRERRRQRRGAKSRPRFEGNQQV